MLPESGVKRDASRESQDLTVGSAPEEGFKKDLERQS